MDELLGMDDAVPDGGDDEFDDDEFDDVEGDLNDPDDYAAFTKRTCGEAAGHADQNRRPGEKKTQASLVRAWDSQIKKLFFAALRLRKLQEADDRTLAAKRPAATTIVYDAVKSRMRESLKRTLSAGGDPNAEDDQDIGAYADIRRKPNIGAISACYFRRLTRSTTLVSLSGSIHLSKALINDHQQVDDGSSYRIFPPILGQRNLAWSDIFDQIKQCILLWELYQPRGLADFYTLPSLWNSYEHGEDASHTNGALNEMHVHILLDTTTTLTVQQGDKQKWKRYREIPQWIEEETRSRQVSRAVVLAELEALRTQPGKSTLLSLNQLVQVVEKQPVDKVKRYQMLRLEMGVC
ncbi:hypothetical protein BDZ89DRAFT_1147946 [Hymenopellis radicata]|nr:hypothetical protein BDZ89DRAFT_1147946 [Hymenopellis radicata]